MQRIENGKNASDKGIYWEKKKKVYVYGEREREGGREREREREIKREGERWIRGGGGEHYDRRSVKLSEVQL